jgi:F-type H+-transporting ATPase subunit gamma
LSSLKELRNRIKTITSTGKITKAMKLVAASKLRKAGEAAIASGPYFEHILKVLGNISANYKEVENNVFLSDVNSEAPKRHLIIVLTSDRGLCGSFNSSMVRMAIRRVRELESAGNEAEIVCVGKKSAAQMQSSYYAKLVVKEFENIKTNDLAFAKELQEYIIENLYEDEFDRCEFIYNKYVSALVQKPENVQIIPFSIDKITNKFDIKPYNGEFIYEPKIEKLLDILMPKAILGIIRHFLLESYASEQAARMNSMDNASKNAADMMEKMTLVLNRSRQALITRELVEIISGAESV